jgi:flagellar hook-associated protein 3 FlgL
MIKGLDSYSEKFLADLSKIQERTARIQREISSGFRVSKSSDAPDQVMNIVQLRSDIERAMTIQTNLDRVDAEVNTAEAAVRVSVQLLERAKVLAAQTASTNATNRVGIAIEVQGLHDQLANLTRTTAEGRYVFSGDLDSQHLYDVDWSQPGGVTRLAQATNTRTIEDVHGGRFSVSRSAHQLFDARDSVTDAPLTENAFVALHELGQALLADDAQAVSAASPKIEAALEHLNRELTFYGHSQNRIDSSLTLTKNSLIERKKALGLARDTDITQALSDLNMNTVHHQTALAAHANLPTSSLFDYLG